MGDKKQDEKALREQEHRDKVADNKQDERATQTSKPTPPKTVNSAETRTEMWSTQ